MVQNQWLCSECIHVGVSLCMYACLYVCVCMCVCMFVCVCMCVASWAAAPLLKCALSCMSGNIPICECE